MSTPAAEESMSRRKSKHLEICTDEQRYHVEGGDPGFGSIHFVHNALPEISIDEVDPSVDFLGYRISVPLHISCLTGGSADGFKANRDLARAAQDAVIPVGMGSIRILIEQPDLFPHFHLKADAPDVPVIANIGAVQLPVIDTRNLLELTKKLEADALSVHLNPGQELFQPGGDKDWRGVKRALGTLCETSALPVIVKETGCGMDPFLVRELLNLGASYVDIAGSGGTNWITVEAYRTDPTLADSAADFHDWGIPTAVSLAAAGHCGGKIIASGGIRTGLDAAKALCLGAVLTGAALPFIRAVMNGGSTEVSALIQRYTSSIKASMFLTGSKNIDALRGAKRWYDPEFAAIAAALENNDHASISD